MRAVVKNDMATLASLLIDPDSNSALTADPNDPAYEFSTRHIGHSRTYLSYRSSIGNLNGIGPFRHTAGRASGTMEGGQA